MRKLFFAFVRRLGSIGGKAGLAAYFFILKIKTMNNQFDPLSDFKSDETVLNLVKEVFEFSVNPHEFASMAFDVRQAFGQYMVRIQREMFGDKVKKDVMVIFTIKHPKTWWQHFKQDNFPAWLLRRFPVQYAIHTENKTVEFDRTFVFPNAYREGHSVLGKFIIRDYHRIQ